MGCFDLEAEAGARGGYMGHDGSSVVSRAAATRRMVWVLLVLEDGGDSTRWDARAVRVRCGRGRDEVPSRQDRAASEPARLRPPRRGPLKGVRGERIVAIMAPGTVVGTHVGCSSRLA